MEMAQALKNDYVVNLFTEASKVLDDADDIVNILDPSLKSSGQRKVKLSININQVDEEDTVDRSKEGYVALIVGDVGTCKTNNAVMARSRSYDWVGITPGDLHNKGYFCEAVFKQHGASGMHYIVCNVMMRKKLTTEVFKRKKFEDNNLSLVREAVRDTCRAYGIAACIQFKDSSFYPSASELAECKKANKNYNQILLKQFKEFIMHGSKNDEVFKHNCTAFTFYGPLSQFYDASTSYGDGIARELVYQLQLPIYAQLGFVNYYQEVFRHVVNFMCKWPIATWMLLRNNCNVNMKGRQGHGIELDGFVETKVVRPLKTYYSGHTTVTMCERIMGNLDLFKAARACYESS